MNQLTMNSLVRYIDPLAFWPIRFFLLLSLPFLFSACGDNVNKKEQSRRLKEEIETYLKANHPNTEELKKLFETSEKQGNLSGVMIYGRVLGRKLRNESLYGAAIDCHHQGLEAAIALKDTIEVAQAYNNLGTDCRRIGALSEASEHHYRALRFIEHFSGVNDSIGIKTRVIALNGIGNINLELLFLDEAEQNFLTALEGERLLKSNIGQAINYSNLGAIYKERKAYARASAYYLLSMEQNRLAKDTLGIGLCYINLGGVAEEQDDLLEARKNFLKAYQLMRSSLDRWHWLGSCIPLARVEFALGNREQSLLYLKEAEEAAVKINSLSHLAEIFELKKDIHTQLNNYAEAIRAANRYIAIERDLVALRNINAIQDSRLAYEREKQIREISNLRRQSDTRHLRSRLYLVFAITSLLLFFLLSVVLTYMNRQGRRRNRLMKQMEELRSDFYTGITHEFRTPITVIQGLNERLDKTNLPAEERKHFHEVIRRQSSNLLGLVTQLLDMSKLRHGINEPVWRHGDVLAFIRLIVEPFEVYAREKNIEFIVYSEEDKVEVDFVPSYLQKILSNLLSNAIKHTKDRGRISIRVKFASQHNKYVVRVQDDGEGIASEDLPRIFDTFFRASHSKGKPGFGVGLAFTKMLIESMNGTIKVESMPGHGSTFSVTLPVRHNVKNPDVVIQPWIPQRILDLPKEEDTSSFSSSSVDAIESKDGKEDRPSVLIVEDNKDVELLLRSLIEDSYQIYTASNGQEAFEKATEVIPDLILSDLMMPVMDGIELARLIRNSPLLNHIPFIVLTALSDDKSRLDAISSGVDVFLNKPFDPEELLLRIEQILINRQRLKEYYVQAVMTDSSDVPLISRQDDENMRFLLRTNDLIQYSIVNDPEFSVQSLADALCLSPSQLNRKITALTGFSSVAYIHQIKIKRSCALLADYSMSIAEVGVLVGFTDPSYFSRLFRRYLGCTPMQYRLREYPKVDVQLSENLTEEEEL